MIERGVRKIAVMPVVYLSSNVLAEGSIPFNAIAEAGSDADFSQHPNRISHSILRSFPNLIEDFGSQSCLVLG